MTSTSPAWSAGQQWGANVPHSGVQSIRSAYQPCSDAIAAARHAMPRSTPSSVPYHYDAGPRILAVGRRHNESKVRNHRVEFSMTPPGQRLPEVSGLQGLLAAGRFGRRPARTVRCCLPHRESRGQ